MNEEIILVQEPGEVEGEVVIEEIESDVEQSSTVEYIDVEEPQEFVIEIEESIGLAGASDGPYAPLEHNHSISEVEKLNDVLHDLASAHDYYSVHGGYAEFRQWKTIGEVGRFVSLVYQDEKDKITGGNTFIEVCSSNNKDVYGVTVSDSALCGYQNENYCILNPSEDRSTSATFAKVCLLGVVSVRQGVTYQRATVGDYVVPDENGCAVLSENGVGFRVVSVGQYSGATDPYWNYRYVDIALVPQNDNVARVMAELEGTKQNLGNLSIQIGKLEDDINDSITSIIPGLNETIKDLNGVVQDKLDAANTALENVQKISSEVSIAIEKANANCITALSDMEVAQTSASKALAGVDQIRDDLSVLDKYKDENTSGIVGFVAKVEEDNSTLATLNSMYGKNGSEITLINQKIDKNGAAIEHLVAHADRYSVGEHSPSYGLSYEEALGVLGKTGKEERNGYIYVPTVNHDEKDTMYSWGDEFVTFEVDKVYVWMHDANGPDDTCHRWQESSIKVSLGNEPIATTDGDLWYTWNGVRIDDVWQYEPETLYRWTAYDNHTGDWIAVARANDGNARTMSFITQTAKEISSTVTNLDGRVSNISQTVDHINSTVLGEDGILTRINQTAQGVMMGVYKSDEGSSALELLLEGMQSTANHSQHICVGEFSGSPMPQMEKYILAPIWTKDGFSFEGISKVVEDSYPMYYFNSDKTTYYCEQVDDDTYKIYTLGNKAMANLNTRVNDTEASVESWTNFETELNRAITSITQKSNEDAAEMVSMVFGSYKYVAAVSDTLTEDEKNAIGSRYNVAPTWDIESRKFVFDEDQIPVDDGLYCIPIGNEVDYYWELVLNGDNEITGYKQYTMKASNYASLMQKTNEDGSSAGLVVGNNKVEGGIFIDAINDSTSATINAERIAINGTTTFADTLNPEKTAISGNYIRTGVIESNNYNGPKTYKDNSLQINIDTEFNLSESPIYTIPVRQDIELPDGKYRSASNNRGYLGIDLDYVIGDYYYKLDDAVYSISIKSELYKYTLSSEGSNPIYATCDIYYYTKDSSSPMSETGDVDIYSGTERQVATIIASDSSSCIYYTPKVSGTRSYEGDKEPIWYYAKNIAIDEEILVEEEYKQLSKEQQAIYQYIVTTQSFDLIPSTIETVGTKFDLDVGTIYSRNFVIDRSGNLTISGKISATSGWIGDEYGNGFEIKSRTNNDKLEYYLGNNQISYDGSILPDGVLQGVSGVYIGPDGIGLGNGNFQVDSTGNIIMQGSITMKTWDIDENLTKLQIQNGNIKLSGNISWLYDGETFIGGNSIYSPNIEGGVITGGIFYSTGIGDGDSNSAYYMCDDEGHPVGTLRYDINGVAEIAREIAPYVEGGGSTSVTHNGKTYYFTADTLEAALNDNPYRVWFTTASGVAMKFQSGGDMSFYAEGGNDKSGYGAGTGKIYFASDVVFMGEVSGNISGGGGTSIAVFG